MQPQGPCMNVMPPVFGYVGPDQLIPLATTAATTVGVLLVFGHRVVEIVRIVGRIFQRKEAEGPASLETADGQADSATTTFAVQEVKSLAALQMRVERAA